MHLLSSRKAETHTCHHFGDTDSSRTTDANAAVDEGCCLVFFASAWKYEIETVSHCAMICPCSGERSKAHQ